MPHPDRRVHPESLHPLDVLQRRQGRVSDVKKLVGSLDDLFL